jgi:F0F1-type ATP synthase epsilon subunit
VFNSPLLSDQTIILTIRSRQKVIFTGPIKAVTSANSKGRFDILPEHAHFISIIRDYIIIHMTDGTEKKMSITRGVLKAQQNTVTIYIGVAAEKVPPAPSPHPAA